MVLGYPTSTSFPRVDAWSMDPWVLRRHNFDELGSSLDSHGLHLQKMMHSMIPLSCSCEYLRYLTHGQEIDEQYYYVHNQ